MQWLASRKSQPSDLPAASAGSWSSMFASITGGGVPPPPLLFPFPPALPPPAAGGLEPPPPQAASAATKRAVPAHASQGLAVCRRVAGEGRAGAGPLSGNRMGSCLL